MLRLTGFLLGVVLVILALFVIVDRPPTARVGDSSRAPVDQSTAAVVGAEPVTEVARDTPSEQDTPSKDARSVDATSATVAGKPPAEVQVTATPVAFESQSEPKEHALVSEDPIEPDRVVAEPAAAGNGSLEPEPVKPTETSHWHVFWKPFQRETSAQGFAAHLAQVTGLEFVVMKQGPGEYAVAFAYRDEEEKRAHLTMIESETGLSLSEKPR